MNDRGQTAQDFAVGTSVLLVTIIGTFAFIQGGGLSVYESPATGIEQPQADRVASYLVEEYSADGQRNVILYDELGSIDNKIPGKFDRLKRRAGVNVSSTRRTDPSLNVTIVNNKTLQNRQLTPATDSGTQLAWGEPYRNQTAGVATRVVRLTNDGNVECNPTCWLVVRAW